MAYVVWVLKTSGIVIYFLTTASSAATTLLQILSFILRVLQRGFILDHYYLALVPVIRGAALPFTKYWLPIGRSYE
jgi:hypothetical protein